MNRISRNISIILKAERLIARRQIAVLRRQTGFMVAAGIVAAMALVMLNVAAYLALAQSMSPALAALIVAAVNTGLAILLVSLALNASSQNETAPAAEVRDLALADLEVELQNFAQEARATADDVRRMVRDPMGLIAPGLAGTIAQAAISALKKK